MTIDYCDVTSPSSVNQTHTRCRTIKLSLPRPISYLVANISSVGVIFNRPLNTHGINTCASFEKRVLLSRKWICISSRIFDLRGHFYPFVWPLAATAGDSGLAKHGVAWFVCLSVCLSVCVSVGQVHEPGKNSWTTREAVWEADSGEPKQLWIRWGRDPHGEGAIAGFVRPIESIGELRCSVRKNRWTDRDVVRGANANANAHRPTLTLDLTVTSGVTRGWMARGSHSFTCHPRVYPRHEWNEPSCMHFVSIHQMASPEQGGEHLDQLTTHLSTPKGWKAELA